MDAARATTLRELRDRLRERGLPVSQPAAPPPLLTGLPALDAALGGGWPAGGLVALLGEPGSGRLGLLLPFLRRAAQERPLALVDPGGLLHPPGLDLPPWRLLLLLPPPPRAAWVAEQCAASGAFGAVLLLEPGRLPRAVVHRLGLAARRGERPLFVLAGPGQLPLSGFRLALSLRSLGSGLEVSLARAPGPPGRRLELRVPVPGPGLRPRGGPRAPRSSRAGPGAPPPAARTSAGPRA